MGKTHLKLSVHETVEDPVCSDGKVREGVDYVEGKWGLESVTVDLIGYCSVTS